MLTSLNQSDLNSHPGLSCSWIKTLVATNISLDNVKKMTVFGPNILYIPPTNLPKVSPIENNVSIIRLNQAFELLLLFKKSNLVSNSVPG